MSAGDRLAIVTGTSTGLGAAIAALVLRGDWTVIGIARRPAGVTHARFGG